MRKAIGKWFDGVTLTGEGVSITGMPREDFFSAFVRDDLALTPQCFDNMTPEDLKRIEQIKKVCPQLSREAIADELECRRFKASRKGKGRDSQGKYDVDFPWSALWDYLTANKKRTFFNIISFAPLLGAIAFKYIGAFFTEKYATNINHGNWFRAGCCLVLGKIFTMAGSLCHSTKVAPHCLTAGLITDPIQNAHVVRKSTGSWWEGTKAYFRSLGASLGLSVVNSAVPASIVVSAGITAPLLVVATGSIATAVGSGTATTAVATHIASYNDQRGRPLGDGQ